MLVPVRGRHVVQNDGKIDPVGHMCVVGHQTVLAGFVVIRGDHQQGVGPQPFGLLRELHGIAGVVAAGTGDDRDPAGRGRDNLPDDRNVLLVIEGGRFARGTAGHQAVDAGGNLFFDQGAQALHIERTVLVHRSNQRGGDTPEYGL